MAGSWHGLNWCCPRMAANCPPKTSLKKEGLVRNPRTNPEVTGFLPTFPSSSRVSPDLLQEHPHLPLTCSETGIRRQSRPALIPTGGPCGAFGFVASLGKWKGRICWGTAGGRQSSEGREACRAGTSCRRCRNTPPPQGTLGSGHEPHLGKHDRKGAGTGSPFTRRNTETQRRAERVLGTGPA